MTSERASYWTRWPDPNAGPLWAGIHVHKRAGVTAIVGVELFTEPPGDARSAAGPEAVDSNAELLPIAPAPLRGWMLRSLRLDDLLERFRGSGPQGAALAAQAPRRTRYTVDHWHRVAQVVQVTQARGERGTAKEVARIFDVSRSTAKKWIARARAEGMLPVR